MGLLYFGDLNSTTMGMITELLVQEPLLLSSYRNVRTKVCAHVGPLRKYPILPLQGFFFAPSHPSIHQITLAASLPALYPDLMYHSLCTAICLLIVHHRSSRVLLWEDSLI